MAIVETYVVQPFHFRRKRLAPSPGVPASTRHRAVSHGRRIALTQAGAAVLRIVCDDETGEASLIEVIERFGDIPEEFEASVRAL